MNKLLTLKKFLKVNTIFLIPLLLLILGLLYTNNFNLNIKNLSQTYFYVIFIVLTSVLMANLNANNKFGVTGAIASVLNLTIVGAIVLTNFYEVN